MPGADPGFLERGFICIREGVALLIWSHIFEYLSETKLFHFHRIFKNEEGF